MSELNPRSVTLAKNIVQADTNELDKRNGEKRRKACSKKPLIVFCDVFTQNEEENYELLLQARELSAICLKKDVSHIDFRSKGESIEIFIIGEDDAENTAQLIALTNKQINSSRTVTIHMFSSDPTSDRILDNLLKTPSISDKLLNSDFEKRLMDIADESLFAHNWQKDYSGLLGNVSVRRIDPVDLLTKTILTYNDYADYRKIIEAADITSTISITVLGMGHYGTQFLKTAIWFYQRSGICVEFNLFDLGIENGDPQKRLAHECPELIKVNPSTENGDAQYDIRFFTGVDCFSSDFDQKLIEEIVRMENTNLVFIALGDDDRNVRAATEMRIAFSRMYASIKKKTPIPFIYTVVNSEEKATYLNESANDPADEGVYPDCRFVSIQKYCYSYNAIKEACSSENVAFKYHLDWVGKENQLRHCYEMAISNDTSGEDVSCCKAFKEELDKEIAEEKKTEAQKAKENGQEKLIQKEKVGEEMSVRWNNAAFYTDGNGKLDYSGPINLAEVRKEVGRYVSESYCRKSSIAKAFHKKSLEVLSEHTSAPFGHSPVCNCDACKTARITEHMRWNAYMRSIGYQKGQKNKIAKLHHDLKSWHDLPCREKYKD